MEKIEKINRLDQIIAKFKRRETHQREWKGDLQDNDYWRLQRRAGKLAYSIARDKPVFDQSDNHKWSLEWYLEGVKSRKEYGLKRFETRYRFGPWFMQTSLGSDYGEYCCSKCGSTFYHSPCNIYLATKQIYNGVCGHCANYFAGLNGDNEIYF